MNRARIICTIILFAGISISLTAQTAVDLERLMDIHSPTAIESDYSSLVSSEGGLKKALSLAFLGYKRYVSSQDGSNCVFHPSCSAYAIESVNKKGVIGGSLAAIDRLTRCHGFSPKQYPIHPLSKRLHDPVE